ncbi:YbaK/EbsC family protein [soil metagenome]
MSSGPMPRLIDWLDERAIEYELNEHEPAYTAADAAAAEGVDPLSFEKVIWVRTATGGDALLVLDSEDQLDLEKARAALRSGRVKLVSEAELERLAPDCEPGAMPAVGRLFDIPTYADYSVRDEPDVSFNAGSHRFAVRVDRAGWERAAGVAYVDLAATGWSEVD